MKVVKELEVLVIEECEFDNEVFCDVISSVVGMSMEVGMSKKDVIKVLVDNKVIKEENGGYVLLNFDNYDYDKMEDWWDNDIYDLSSGYRI